MALGPVTGVRRPKIVPTIPLEVEELAPRMREIATIVYLTGGATISEISERIEDDLDRSGLRTLLSRLAVRNIVIKRRSGRHSEIIYLPAIVNRRIRDSAVNRLIAEHFDNSPERALAHLMRMMEG